MSQYSEAMMRLNAPERDPLIRPVQQFGPYRKDFNGSKHYNKIMKESAHSRLPKYALPQRLPFVYTGEINSDQKFLLNDGFTFCEGDRKSIGVRRIDLELSHYSLHAKIHFRVSLVDNDFESDFLYNSPILGSDLYLNTVDLMNKFVKYINEETHVEWDIERIINYDAYTQKIVFGLVILSDDIDDLGNCDMTLDMTRATGEYFAADFYNQPEAAILADVNLNVNTHRYEFTWTFRDLIDWQNLQVSASFNPYSQNNIIGSLQEEYHNGPFLFPYDRNPEVHVKICDRYGIPIHFKNCQGYIDLDLIIDNSSNYSIDA
jgi:hypothetical protein